MDGVKLRKTMVSTVFVILIAIVKQLNIIYMVDTKHVTVACILGHPEYGIYSGHSAVRADKSPDNLTCTIVPDPPPILVNLNYCKYLVILEGG